MATNYTLKIDAGADKFLAVRLVDDEGGYIDMTGFSARMKLKKAYDSADSMVSLDSESGGGITFEKFDEEQGLFPDTCSVHITDEQTGPLVDYTVKDSDGEVEQGEGVYDLEIVDETGIVVRAIQGMWIAFPEVTK